MKSYNKLSKWEKTCLEEYGIACKNDWDSLSKDQKEVYLHDAMVSQEQELDWLEIEAKREFGL